jgi:hypothetical protein
MFCGKCGSQVDDGLAVCPFCGSALQAPVQNPGVYGYQQNANQQFGGYQQYQNNGYQQGGQNGYGAQQYGGYQQQGQGNYVINRPPVPPAPPGKKAKAKKAKNGKKGKFPLAPVIACVLVVALVLTGIFAGPHIPFLSNLFGNGYASDNAFAKAAKKMGKKDENYPLMNAFAAADNLIFNTKSFSFECEVYHEIKVSGKVTFGKDIPSTQAYIEVKEDGEVLGRAAMTDGRLIVAEDGGYSNWSVDVKELCDHRADLEDAYFDLMEDSYKGNNSRVAYYNFTVDTYNELITDSNFESSYFSIIKDNRVNRDALNTFADCMCAAYNSAVERGKTQFGITDEEFVKINPEGVTVNDAFTQAADFLAELPEDAVEIDTEDRSGNSFDYKINGGDTADAFYDFFKNSQTIKKALPGSLFASLCEESQYYLDDFDGETLKGHVEIENNRLASVTAKYGNEEIFSLKVTDINGTKITEDDFSKAEKMFKKADNAYKVDNAKDVPDEDGPVMFLAPRFTTSIYLSSIVEDHAYYDSYNAFNSAVSKLEETADAQFSLGNLRFTNSAYGATGLITIGVDGNGKITLTLDSGLTFNEAAAGGSLLKLSGVDTSKSYYGMENQVIVCTSGIGGYVSTEVKSEYEYNNPTDGGYDYYW